MPSDTGRPERLDPVAWLRDAAKNQGPHFRCCALALLGAADAIEEQTTAPAYPSPQNERVPSAWSEFGDGHDYSRTGKHDPNNCRHCLRAVMKASPAPERAALVELADRAHQIWNAAALAPATRATRDAVNILPELEAALHEAARLLKGNAL